MTGPFSNEIDRTQLAEKLLREVRETSRVYAIAAANHNRAIQEAQARRWRNSPDETETIYEAGRTELAAIQAYLQALKAYSELIVYGRKPETGPPEAMTLLDLLTPRETEVLRLIVAGLSSKEISARLGISFKTVVCHRSNLMKKFHVHDTVTLVRYAIRNRLVEP